MYRHSREVRAMIKIDTIGREWCLPCADRLEVEGVIVEREGECLGCEREGAILEIANSASKVI